MSTYLELKAQAETLMKKANEARKREIAEVVSDIKQKMAAYDLTAADLGFSGTNKRNNKRSGASGPAIVRYKGPEGQTWSGMGRQPTWLKEAIEQGKSKDDFAV